MAYITGIGGSGTAQYFTDENGNAVPFKCDTAWALIMNAGNAGGAVTWQSDIDNYVSTRASQGFNATEVVAPGTTIHGGVNDDGQTWDGQAVFVAGDPGSLNNGWWNRLDYLVSAAAGVGMTVVVNMCNTTAMERATGALSGKTNTQFTNYGTALGLRYGAAPNIVWMPGEDYFGNEDTQIALVLTALRAAGDAHLIAVENYAETTSRKDIFNSTTLVFGSGHAQFNWVYSYNVTYAGLEYGATEASPLPVMWGDGHYDQGTANRSFMRNMLWWALSSGARGFCYGSEAIYPWTASPSSLALLTTNTPFDNSDWNSIWSAFTGLTGWNKLVPDTSSALVTAGRGTHAAMLTSGGGPEYTGGNTYVTASKVADGSLAVIYLPSNSTITVNNALMATGFGAKWMDPVTGATSTATIASTYSNASANSVGEADWVLVLASPPYATWTVP
jgi:hypothetical protein